TSTLPARRGAAGPLSPSGTTHGTSGCGQNYAIAPDACHTIADVLVDGVSVGAVSTYTFSGIAGGHTISVTFNTNVYVITASAGPGGTISPSGATNVTCGGGQNYPIAPDAGLTITDVLVDGVSVGAVANDPRSRVTAGDTIKP